MAKDTVLDAWGKGLGAACKGALVTQNPYPEDTKLAEVWAKGWERAANTRHARPEAEARNS